MLKSFSTALIAKDSPEEIVAHRDRAVELYKRGLDYIAQAFEAHQRAAQGSAYFPDTLRRYEPLPRWFDDVRKEVDSDTWRHLIEASGLRNLMDSAELQRFREQVEKDPPEVSTANLLATFDSLRAQRGDIFKRGVVNLFKSLAPRFAAHDRFRLGRKIVLECAMGEWGGIGYGWRGDQVGDLDRIFHVLDGKPPKDHRGDARAMVNEASHRKQHELETDYFRFRWFANRNLHVQFKRPDLVAAANRIVAEHYGETLPDARRPGR